MMKVTDVVRNILSSSTAASEAMRAGILNMSAFAKQITEEVERRTYKPVAVGTIVVALSRIAKDTGSIPPLQPIVVLEELAIQSPLCDITYEKTARNVKRAQELLGKISRGKTSFFTLTQGIHEITLIASQELAQLILKTFPDAPKSRFDHLMGITVRFSDAYLSQPNIIYAILTALAIKRVNLLEIVSTYTELTMVIAAEDLAVALGELNRLFPTGTPLPAS